MDHVRGIFFDEEHAQAVVDRLVRDGYGATVVRERLAGEDDEEGHPWAVLTDAPVFAFELLIDEYDGWLDEEDPPPSEGATPLALPTEPKRLKRT